VKDVPYLRWSGWLSLMIVAGYFVVGLWPFDFHPTNRVSWLTGRPGLQFAPYGMAYATGLLSALHESGGSTPAAAKFTVELWLEAQPEPASDVFDIMSIHNPQLPFDFVLGQWKQDFLLRATTRHPGQTGKIPEVGVDNALVAGMAQCFTVCGDGTGTDFYLDGTVAGHFPQFVLNGEALDGQLILGNNASGKNSWTGRLLGLAVYHRALNPAEIARHCMLWKQGHARQLTTTPGLTAFYLFDEAAGQLARDSSGNHRDVIIPAGFRPIQRDFLIPPWKDLSYYRPDYADIAVNILGFAPFGFCFFLHRCRLQPGTWVANTLVVVLTGATVSLTIEIIQAWLPNRTSSTTDVLTNTAGTLLGVVLALAARTRIRG